MTVFPAIGYPAADQSHFTSRHYWEVGELSAHANTGWLGRMLDVVGTDENPLQGLSLDGSLSPSLATAKVPVAATWGASYDLWAPGVWGEVEDLMFESFGRLGAAAEASADAQLRGAGRVVRQAGTLREQLRAFSDDVDSPVPYPDSGHFSESLAGLAAMLGAGLPITVASVGAPGSYDTHDEQAEDFRNYLAETCDGLLAFQRDLEARGLDDRVVTLVWSEFGRRPEENGSAGTDHGAGGNAFLIGTPARGQMVGEWPGLKVLDEDDNLRSTVRLPRRLLLARRAVVRRRRRRRDPGGLGLRPARADRMSSAGSPARPRCWRLPAPYRSHRRRRPVSRAPSRLLVTAREYSLTLSRPKIARRSGDRPALRLRRGPPRPRTCSGSAPVGPTRSATSSRAPPGRSS